MNVAVGFVGGVPEIVAGAGVGGRPAIAVFDARTGTLIRSFYAFDPSFRDGVNVAAGDIQGTG